MVFAAAAVRCFSVPTTAFDLDAADDLAGVLRDGAMIKMSVDYDDECSRILRADKSQSINQSINQSTRQS